MWELIIKSFLLSSPLQKKKKFKIKHKHEKKHRSYLRNVGSTGSSNVLIFALSFCIPHSCPICTPVPNCTWTRNHRWRNCSSPIRAFVRRPGPIKEANAQPVHDNQQLTFLSWPENVISFLNILHAIQKTDLKEYFPFRKSPAWLTHWTGRMQNIIWYWSIIFKIAIPYDWQIFVWDLPGRYTQSGVSALFISHLGK